MKTSPSACAAGAVLAAGIALAGCGSGAGHGTASPGGGTASAEVSQPVSPHTSVRLVWIHTARDTGETQVWYVARVTNLGGSPASVALDARALDSTGTIIDSNQETLPNTPARSQFDYFGCLGGGGGACAFNSSLTGTPAKIEVSQAPNAFGQAGAIDLPMLKTSEITLTSGSEDTFTNAAYSYNLTAKVTNTTRQQLTGGVTQQVVLYDKAGHVVGGGSGSSDNVPDTLPAGMSYREQWTGIPAVHHAGRAAYTVWPAS
jgi:hypothetical protein